MYQRQVPFVEAVKMALQQNYCNFSGRSSRSEYWWFWLFGILGSFIITCIFGRGTAGPIVSGVFGLAILLPSLGVAVRRMHDIGRSGWWFLINLIPIVGQVIWIFWCCKDSEMHPNQYGPVPNVVA